MIIRKATSTDAEFIAPHLLLAMKDIVYKFIGEKDYHKAIGFLEYFIRRENNQYSHQHCYVAEESDQVIAAVNLYDGARLKELRQPVIEHIHNHFNEYLYIEDETQPGEYYIDSLGVNPQHQGKGIGTKILQFLIQKYVNEKKQTLGLLVDENNPNAKRLYLKLGFKLVGKKVLLGNSLEHLQIYI